MRKIALLLFLFSTTSTFAQTEFQIITDEKSGKPMLVGITDREAYRDTNFSSWFDTEYQNYLVDTLSVIGLKEKINDFKVTIVLGTWCGDSKREVPRLLKIFDIIEMQKENYTFINVDRQKKGMTTEADGMNIMLVPTMIFYKDGNEIGRIIETPAETLEIDLINILKFYCE
ncbi:MAG: thioredoxin family protein [bacterium]